MAQITLGSEEKMEPHKENDPLVSSTLDTVSDPSWRLENKTKMSMAFNMGVNFGRLAFAENTGPPGPIAAADLLNQNLIKKAQNALNSTHLLGFEYDPAGEIRALVQASMKNKVYDVKLVLEGSIIRSAECSCPKGRHICHHMAVAALHSTSLSRTDIACSWNRRKEPSVIRPISELFGDSNFCAVRRQPDKNDLDWLRDAVKDGNCELKHLVNNEFNDENVLDFSKYFFDTVMEGARKLSGNKVDFILDRFKVNDKERKLIFLKTVGQSVNFLWGSIRKGRFTASNFEPILNAVRKREIHNSLFKTLCGEYEKATIKAIQWGSMHEQTAIEIYSEVKQCFIEKCGLFLHETGLLGCSPDGLIEDDKMIEVKCPYSMREANSVLRAVASGKWYLIIKPDVSATCYSSDGILVYEFSEGDVSLNLNNSQGVKYYHQIQGNLHLLNREICDLIIWTPSVVLIIPIRKETSWESNLAVLTNFYKNVFIYKFLNR